MGTGMSFGLRHVQLLRRVIRDDDDVSAAFADATEAELRPWHDSTVRMGRARIAEMNALRTGETLAPPQHIGARVGKALPAAMSRDPEVFRAALEINTCLSLPRDVFARPGFAEHVLELAADTPPAPLGPNREELLTLLR
jgi:hypothetical protein